METIKKTQYKIYKNGEPQDIQGLDAFETYGQAHYMKKHAVETDLRRELRDRYGWVYYTLYGTPRADIIREQVENNYSIRRTEED